MATTNWAQEMKDTFIYSCRQNRMYSFASVSLVVAFSCHFVSTIPDEVDWVWGSRVLAIGPIAYLFTRYLSLFSLLFNGIRTLQRAIVNGGQQVEVDPNQTSEYLNYDIQAQPSNVSYYVGLAVLLMSMVLLQVRTTALLGNPRWLVILFALMDIGCLMCVISFQVFLEEKGYEDFVWMPLLAVEFFTLCFTLRRTYLVYKGSYGRRIVISSMLEILIRDNILYFVVTLLVYAIGIGLTTALQSVYGALDIHFEVAVALSGIIAPMLFIRLRKAQAMHRENANVCLTDMSFRDGREAYLALKKEGGIEVSRARTRETVLST